MAVAALKTKLKQRIFHAIVHVTKVEDSCVEAETEAGAPDLFGIGRRLPDEHRRLRLEVEALKRACSIINAVQSPVVACWLFQTNIAEF